MTHAALVIDDDPGIREVVADILDSLGHEYDLAASQDEARNLLGTKPYSYILLDLEIPVRAGRGMPRIQNGENLLAEIRRQRGIEKAPVIVMTGHGLDCPDLAVKVMKNGATDFVKKPFPSTGNTLDKAIRDALARGTDVSHGIKPNGHPPTVEKAPHPFSGGEMVFYKDRVEIGGVKVPGSDRRTLARRVLDALRERRPNGKHRAYSGIELGNRVGCQGEQNRIAGAIRDLRQGISQALLDDANCECGRQDVIQSGGPGYRFMDWIVVQEADGENTGSSLQGHDPVNDPANQNGDPVTLPVADPDDPVNRRREWIMGELRKGRQLRAPAIAAERKCSSSTAKRDLESLRAAGLVVFVGPSKTGFYQVKE